MTRKTEDIERGRGGALVTETRTVCNQTDRAVEASRGAFLQSPQVFTYTGVYAMQPYGQSPGGNTRVPALENYKRKVC